MSRKNDSLHVVTIKVMSPPPNNTVVTMVFIGADGKAANFQSEAMPEDEAKDICVRVKKLFK